VRTAVIWALELHEDWLYARTSYKDWLHTRTGAILETGSIQGLAIFENGYIRGLALYENLSYED
jgi:hypothetical protein